MGCSHSEGESAPQTAWVIHQEPYLLEWYELSCMVGFETATGGNITAINPLLFERSLRIAEIILVLYSIPFSVQLIVVYAKGLETCDLFHNATF